MQHATPMKHIIGQNKVETHEIVVCLMRAHSKDGSMRHSPVLSRPRTKDALGVYRNVAKPSTQVDVAGNITSPWVVAFRFGSPNKKESATRGKYRVGDALGKFRYRRHVRG